MSLADIIISLIIFIFQKLILPILPVSLPLLSFNEFQTILNGGSLKHNFIWGLAGLNQFMNLNLVFILIGIVIFAEILFWGIKAGIFIVKLVRGSG